MQRVKSPNRSCLTCNTAWTTFKDNPKEYLLPPSLFDVFCLLWSFWAWETLTVGLLHMKLREEENSWNCSTPLKCLVGRIVELIYLKCIFILQKFMMAASCKSVFEIIVSILIVRLHQKWKERLFQYLKVGKVPWKLRNALVFLISKVKRV